MITVFTITNNMELCVVFVVATSKSVDGCKNFDYDPSTCKTLCEAAFPQNISILNIT